MASLAEVRVEEAEPMENETQARPEELRLLEALLFASVNRWIPRRWPSACPRVSTSRRRSSSSRPIMPCAG